MSVQELNESEPMMKPRKGNRSYQKQAVTFVLAKGSCFSKDVINVSDDLISGYMITGVKLARTVHRLSYGTREVNIVL